MNAASEDIVTLAGEYVLGLLDPEQQRILEQRLQNDSALAVAVAEWRMKFSELDEAAPQVAPSPGLWAGIERALAADSTHMTAARGNAIRRLWESLRFWRLAGFAGAAASIVLAIGLAMQFPAMPKPVVVAVLEAQDSTPGAIVEAYADGSIRLVPLTDIPVPAGRALQVWTLWDQARGPVPLGLLDSAHQVVLTVGGQPTPKALQIYEITLEPAAGSPTGRPTGPVLYKGFAAVPR